MVVFLFFLPCFLEITSSLSRDHEKTNGVNAHSKKPCPLRASVENPRSFTENIYGDGPGWRGSLTSTQNGGRRRRGSAARASQGRSRNLLMTRTHRKSGRQHLHEQQQPRTKKTCSARSRKSSENLLVSLFPSPQAWSVVISEAQEVVIRHQTLNGVTHHIYIHWLVLHPIS